MSESSIRLEPFLLIARSTKGAAAAKVIRDVLGAAGVFSFVELLEMPNIQEAPLPKLKSSETPALADSYKLLELFAYGTFEEYISHQMAYGVLSTAQILKLKQLTLVTLGMTSRSLAYPRLMAILQIPSTRDLEDLIIDSIYAGLLAGKLSSRDGGLFHVDWVMGRDVDIRERGEGSGSAAVGLGGSMDLGDLKARLETWCSMTSSLLQSIDDKILVARTQSSYDNDRTQSYLSKRDELLNKIEKEMKDPKSKKKGNGDDSSGTPWSTSDDSKKSIRAGASGFGGGVGNVNPRRAGEKAVGRGETRGTLKGQGSDLLDDRGDPKGKGRR